MKKKMRYIQNARSTVAITDYSDYDANNCINGGSYSFTTYYHRLPRAMWEVSYGTSAEFDYCPRCGNFGNHYDDRIEDYCCSEQKVISTGEVEKAIKLALNDKDQEVCIDGQIIC